MRRRSIQEMFADAKSGASDYLNNAYGRFNNNRAVFPRKGRPMPRPSGIETIPFDVGSEADNARRGGMSEYQIQAMLARAKRPGLPIAPSVRAAVEMPLARSNDTGGAQASVRQNVPVNQRGMGSNQNRYPVINVPYKDMGDMLIKERPGPPMSRVSANALGVAEQGMASMSPPAPAIMPMEQDLEIGDRGGRLPSSSRPLYAPDERVSDSAAATLDLYAAGSPTDEARKRPNLEQAYGSPPNAIERPVSAVRPLAAGRLPGSDAVKPGDMSGASAEELDAAAQKGSELDIDAPKAPPVEAPKEEAESGIDFNTDLMKLGLQITAAASKPGATFMGSLAKGALNHLNSEEKLALIKEEREFKRELIKSNEKYKSAESALARASTEKISAARINVLQEQVKARSEELAETRRFNNERLELQLDQLPTGADKDAARNLIESKIGVNNELAKYHEAKASGVGNELAKQTEITKRSIFALVEKMIDTDTREYRSAKGDERAALLQRDARAALKAIGLVGSEIEEFLPGGVTDLSGAGKSPPPPGKTLKFNPKTGKIE